MNYSISFQSPAYLLLLAVIPVMWFVSRKSLASLGRVRAAVALAVRSIVVLLVVLALAEIQFIRSHDRLTVFYLVDRSLSIPESASKSILDYVNASIREHLRQSRADRAGVIVFGREAAIELPPFDEAIPLADRIETVVEGEHTCLADALQLAQAAFPPDGAKRIVVISDGNENLGSAREEARLLARAGIGIDVVPIRIAANSDVSVERVVVPSAIRQGAPFDLRIVLENAVPEGQQGEPVAGKLRVTRKIGGQSHLLSEEDVTLEPGKRVFSLREQIEVPDFYTYEAQFVPDEGVGERFRQNNRAIASAHVQGRGRVLLIEDWSAPGEAEEFVERLREENLDVDVVPSNTAFTTLGELQRYDAVVLSNVPRTSGEGAGEITAFSDRQIEALVRNTRETGAGLIMLGGPNSFGVGGWANTKLEEAMPVDFQIKNLKVVPNGALMLVIDHSGSMSGEKLELAKSAAIEAVRVLGPRDQVGIVAFDSLAHWIVRMQPAKNPNHIAARVKNLGVGGGTHIWPGMYEGYEALRNVEAAVKHMIILTDGQSEGGDYVQLATRMRGMNMTVTCVAVGQDADDFLLDQIARAGGGKFYHVDRPTSIPRIFMKEARRVARPLIYEDERGFTPQFTSSHEIVMGLNDPLPSMTGFVMTSLKDSPLVEVPLISPKPGGPNGTLLAAWPYGLGRSVAWTTDVGQRWTKPWPGWEGYDKLFAQMVRWALRPSGDNGEFSLVTSLDGDKVNVIVSGIGADEEYINFLNMSGTVVRPDMEGDELLLRQTAPGRYVGEFSAEEAGNYFVTIMPEAGKAPLRAGVTVPYSDEFDSRTTNEVLLEELAESEPAGGEAGEIIDPPGGIDNLDGLLATNVFRGGLTKATSSRDGWYLLVFAAACLFLADVMNRRVMFNFHFATLMEKLRARLAARRKASESESLSRLKRAKATIADQMEARQAATRFEPTAETSQSLEELEDVTAGAKPQAPAPQQSTATLAPGENDAEDSYTSRLLKAKREVWKQR